MIPPVHPTFSYRENHDGTADSVCQRCYVTVCTSKCETDLHRAEKKHVCDVDFLARWRRMTRFALIDRLEP